MNGCSPISINAISSNANRLLRVLARKVLTT